MKNMIIFGLFLLLASMLVMGCTGEEQDSSSFDTVEDVEEAEEQPNEQEEPELSYEEEIAQGPPPLPE